MINSTAQHSHGERGGGPATLFILAPATMFLLAVLLDLSGWFLLREEAQLRVDIAALAAARRLPNRDAALAVLRELLGHQADTALEATATGIRVAVAWQYTPPLASHVLGRQRPLLIRLESEVEVAPRDYILVVADGAQLRPSWHRQQDGGYALEVPWDDEWDDSRQSPLHCLAAPRIAAAEFPWWSAWSQREVRRWLLQACNNPVLTPLKQAALAAVHEAAAFNINRLALIFTPGAAPNGATLTRPLLGLRQQFVNADGIEARWVQTLASDLSVSDESCALFSESTQGTVNSCPIFTDPPRCGDPYRAYGIVSDCYRTGRFTLSDAIRWHAIRSDTDHASGPDLLAALKLSEHELALAPSAEQLQELKARRPTHWHQHSPVILILTDTLPDPELLLPQLSPLLQRGASIAVVAFLHRGLSPNEAHTLSERVRLLQEDRSDFTHLNVILLDSPSLLPQATIEQLADLGRRYALKR